MVIKSAIWFAKVVILSCLHNANGLMQLGRGCSWVFDGKSREMVCGYRRKRVCGEAFGRNADSL